MVDKRYQDWIDLGYGFEAEHGYVIVEEGTLCDETLGNPELTYEDQFASVQLDELYINIASTHRHLLGKDEEGNLVYSDFTNNYNNKADTVWDSWNRVFGEVIQGDVVGERKQVFNMDALEYREYTRENLEAKCRQDKYEFEFDGLEFEITSSERLDVVGQIAMGMTEIEIHDKHRKHLEPYSASDAAAIMTVLATTMKTHKYAYDSMIKALYELNDGFTKADVDLIAGNTNEEGL